MTSPDGSTHRQVNCIGEGVVNVLKLRYLIKSNALTVPSSEEENTTCPFLANSTWVTADECSVNVTKQKPEMVFQSLSLPSSAPVAIVCESGEYESVFMS